MTLHGIEIPEHSLAEFCRRNHIRVLSFFGSILRGDFRPGSDVDVLVEFETGHTPGLALIRMEDELAALLGGRKVDLVIRDALLPRLRQRILQEAEVQFVQKVDKEKQQLANPVAKRSGKQPSWKRPALRLSAKGVGLSAAIIGERRREGIS